MQVIERAAAILRALRDHAEGLSLAQLAAEVGLARSTVHRIVIALQREGFVAPVSPQGKVQLGPGLVALAATAATRDHVAVARPHLTRLSQAVEETVDLAVLMHDHVLFVDQVAAPRRLRAVSAVGATFPLHCSANGKALLATLPRAQVLGLLPARMTRFTEHTITDRDALLAELDAVRATGIAVDREEHTEGICALARTVSAPDGWTAAVTIPLPTQRFERTEDALAQHLREACAALEADLAAR